ncbi:MAG: acetyltransferase [Bacteroidales bacterium]|nr:acetyltransferase [Bacteroidales bacterium]
MNKKKKKIILIGGGGHCSSVIDVIEQQSVYEIAGIVGLKKEIGQQNMGYKIIASDDNIPYLTKHYNNYLITLGQLQSAEKRIKLYTLLKGYNINFPVIISPMAYVSKHSAIGPGSVVMHFAQINANAIIGCNCIINSKALIEHDAVIEDHCHISTAAIINGGVIVGRESFIGSGTVTKQYIKILPNSFIKANSTIAGAEL